MRWKRVGPTDTETAENFLRERERDCAAAAARFRVLESTGFDARSEGAAWIALTADDEGQERPASLLIRLNNGVLYPLLDEPEDQGNVRGILRLQARLSGWKPLRSIQGRRSAVEAVERVVEGPLRPIFTGPRRTAIDRVDFMLMSLDSGPAPEALAAGPRGLEIFVAGAESADALFPLQKAYEKEEVVPAGAVYNEAAARLAFERSLRDQIVLYAVLDGHPVAKAQTNAHAYSFDQLGGVFTLPEYRGRGLATRITAELCRRLRAQGRSACLFVKQRNAAAIAAYHRVGFEDGPPYRITYYLKEAST